ncbi:MAG: hypothetical protein ACRDOK_04585 [Streptosporangiaceae bacterium]
MFAHHSHGQFCTFGVPQILPAIELSVSPAATVQVGGAGGAGGGIGAIESMYVICPMVGQEAGSQTAEAAGSELISAVTDGDACAELERRGMIIIEKIADRTTAMVRRTAILMPEFAP